MLCCSCYCCCIMLHLHSFIHFTWTRAQTTTVHFPRCVSQVRVSYWVESSSATVRLVQCFLVAYYSFTTEEYYVWTNLKLLQMRRVEMLVLKNWKFKVFSGRGNWRELNYLGFGVVWEQNTGKLARSFFNNNNNNVIFSFKHEKVELLFVYWKNFKQCGQIR